MKPEPRLAQARIRTGEVSGPHRRAPRHAPRETTATARTRRSSLPRGLLPGRIVRGAGLLLLALLSALGVVQVASWVERARVLPLQTVTVQGGDRALEQEVLAYAAVEPGQPLFGVDLDAVAARVLEHPYVARAQVRRVAPDGLEIVVERRVAQALVAVAGDLYLVDNSGAVFKRARPGDGLDLPVITGLPAEEINAGGANSTLREVLELARAHESAGAPGGALAEVAVLPAIGFELVLEDGTRVRLGRERLKEKLARLDWVVRRLSSEGRRAEWIDLDDDRRPERAAVRLRPGAETRPVGG